MVLLGEFHIHFLSYGHPWTFPIISLETTTSFPSLNSIQWNSIELKFHPMYLVYIYINDSKLMESKVCFPRKH